MPSNLYFKPNSAKATGYELVRGDGGTRNPSACSRCMVENASAKSSTDCTKRGVEGDSTAARASLALIEEARKQPSAASPLNIVFTAVAPGSVTSALEPLRMAKKLDPYRETARMVLEPWLVEAALARLDRTLSPADQRTIVKATRTPHKVRWPKWWSGHS
jgi:hypothetical protein